MATAAEVPPGGRASMGKALELAFGTIFRNPVATLGTALVLGAIPAQLFQTFIVGAAPSADFSSGASLAGYVASLLGGVALSLILGALVQAVIMRVTIAHAQGERASLAEGLADGLAVVLPVIGLSILMALGIMLGFILLIVPGIMLYVMWFVAVPALVVEREGVFAAFGRSRYLTAGARWRIFGLIVLLIIIASVLSGVVGVALVAGIGSGAVDPASITAMADGTNVATFVVNILVSTISTTIMATVAAAVYVQLRNWKDGPDSTRLEDIFA